MSDDLGISVGPTSRGQALTSWLDSTQVVLDLASLASARDETMVFLSFSASHSDTSRSNEKV